MITVYYLDSTQSTRVREIEGNGLLPSNPVWIDLYNPTLEEERHAEQQLNIQIPSREEVWKNETLNRFYEEDGLHYLTAAIITKISTPYPHTSAITFALAKDYLLTVRYIAPTSFQNFSSRIRKHGNRFTSGYKVLHGLLEEIISRVAYNSEIVVNDLDNLSHKIFGTDVLQDDSKKAPTSAVALKEILKTLGRNADLNSKISESLHSIIRLVHYLSQVKREKDSEETPLVLQTEVTALIHQTSFLSDKITFLLDATLGMINVEQNMIIKLFSVVTVFFLPPTLLSSIYGMNFHHMPELDWAFGYPVAVILMVICGLAPFLYFRKKGWL